MGCNLYITTEPERKLRQLFSNAKNFYMLDVAQLIKQMGLDPSKNTSIYIINEEIQHILTQQSALKRNLGIFYIVGNLTETLINSIKKKVASIHTINGLTLIDNGQMPAHTSLCHLFSDVIFYDRFRKNKIMQCTGIPQDFNEDDTLTKALSQLACTPDDVDEVISE